MKCVKISRIAVALLICLQRTQADDFSLWEKRCSLSVSGYNRATPLTNFPVLVVFSGSMSGFSYSQFQSGTNDDLRFVDAESGAELPYEIESWNTSGLSYVWVRKPLLTNSAVFWALWGKAGVTAPSYRTNGAVWADNFNAVWHLADEFDNTVAMDSSPYGRHASNGATTNVQGVVGWGQGFNFSAAGALTNSAGLGNLSVTGVTVEGWVNLRNGRDYPMVLTYNGSAMDFRFLQTSRRLQFAAVPNALADTSNAIPENEWHHVAAAFDDVSDTATLYVDGRPVKTASSSSVHMPSGGICYIGRRSDNYYFDGFMDELRVSGVGRSSDWIWASWMNQASNSLFWQWGPVESMAEPRVTSLPATGVTWTSAFLSGSLVSTGFSQTAVFVYWGAMDGGTNPAQWSDYRVWTEPQMPGLFTTNVAVQGGREYYYRFAASNSAGVSWAPETQYFITSNVTVRVNPSVIGENTQTAVFQVARSAALTGSALNVRFETGGTASQNLDYTIAPWPEATIYAGATSATINLTSWGDIVAEPDETVIVSLLSESCVTAGEASASVIITNVSAGTSTDVWWVGKAGIGRWSLCANWTNGLVPSTNGAAAIRFDQTDSGRLILMDPDNLPVSSDAWRVGNFNVANSASGYVDFCHTHDLGGNRLAVEGDFSVARAGSYSDSWARVVFSNGVLKIGTASLPRSIVIGEGTGPSGASGRRYGELVVAPGAVFDATNLQDIVIGSGYSGGGVLDLRGATVAGGVLNVRDLRFCLQGNGSYPLRNMFLLLNSATQLSEIRIARNFDYAFSQQYTVRMGDPADSYRLPPGIGFSIGSPSSRGRIYVAYNPYMGGSSAYLAASSGGWFTAWITNWTVHPGYFGSGKPVTYVDLRAMTNIFVDCAGPFSIGSATVYGYHQMGYDAQVRLGPGSVACSNLNIGDSLVAGSLALLELQGTTCRVSNSLTIGPYGSNIVTVVGTNCGLWLRDNTAVSASAPGGIRIRFTAPPAAAESTPYVGLRWDGNHMSELSAMRSAGTLSFVSEVSGYSAGLLYDSASNSTYVALQRNEDWIPVAVARNLILEIAPPEYTNVVIGVEDVDAGSFDPLGVPITGRWIRCDQDLTPADPWVTLDTAGAYTIWLTVVNSNGVAGSNCSAVTVGSPSRGTNADLTWDGGATLTYMARPDWMFSMNWVGDVPPQNPTSGAITFDDLGIGTNRLEGDRSIGALVIKNESGRHTFDLGGHALSVNGNITINPDQGGHTSQVMFLNGVVRIGNESNRRNVVIGSGEASYYTAFLSFSTGCVLETWINTLTVGGGDGGRGNLDLRGCTVSQGVFDVTDILMGTAGNGARYERPCEIRLDESTSITEMKVRRNLDISAHEHNTCRIGNPSNDWKMPTNASLTVGSQIQRGRIRVGYGYWNGDGKIGSACGGVFTAVLTDFLLGRASPSRCNSRAFVDFASMSNCHIDVSGSVFVGYSESFSSSDGNACTRLSLPPGDASAGDLIVGLPIGTNVLVLNGTIFTVTNRMIVGQSGRVTNFVAGAASGINLADCAALSVSNGGVISILFVSPQTGGCGPYWGLRWDGNHRAELDALVGEGKLLLDKGPIWNAPVVFCSRGATYVGYPPRGGTVFVVK